MEVIGVLEAVSIMAGQKGNNHLRFLASFLLQAQVYFRCECLYASLYLNYSVHDLLLMGHAQLHKNVFHSMNTIFGT